MNAGYRAFMRRVMCHTRHEMSKEWVRSWSHDFWIDYHKKLTEKLLAVRPEKVDEKEKKKEKNKLQMQLQLQDGTVLWVIMREYNEKKKPLTYV